MNLIERVGAVLEQAWHRTGPSEQGSNCTGIETNIKKRRSHESSLQKKHYQSSEKEDCRKGENVFTSCNETSFFSRTVKLSDPNCYFYLHKLFHGYCLLINFIYILCCISLKNNHKSLGIEYVHTYYNNYEYVLFFNGSMNQVFLILSLYLLLELLLSVGSCAI